MAAPAGSRGSAPLLSRTSGRSGPGGTTTSGGTRYGPWYLRTTWIILLCVVLLVALALGVGLGVGLTRDNGKSSKAVVGAAAGSSAGTSTVTENTTVGGGETTIGNVVTSSASGSVSYDVTTESGSVSTGYVGVAGTSAAMTETFRITVSGTNVPCESWFAAEAREAAEKCESED